jgi:predicted oxidoreductase
VRRFSKCCTPLQALHKAVALELENEDWFAIWSESMGQEVP